MTKNITEILIDLVDILICTAHTSSLLELDSQRSRIDQEAIDQFLGPVISEFDCPSVSEGRRP